MELPIEINLTGLSGVKESIVSINNLAASLDNLSRTNLNDKLNELQQSLFLISKAFNASKNESKEYKEELGRLFESTQSLVSQIKSIQYAQEISNKTYQETQKSIENLTKQYDKVSSRIEVLSNQTGKTGAAFKKWNEELKTAQDTLELTGKSIKALEEHLKTVEAPARQMSGTFGQLKASLKELIEELNEESIKNKDVQAEIQELTGKILKMDESVKIATVSQRILSDTNVKLAETTEKLNNVNTEESESLIKSTISLKDKRKEVELEILSNKELIKSRGEALAFERDIKEQVKKAADDYSGVTAQKELDAIRLIKAEEEKQNEILLEQIRISETLQGAKDRLSEYKKNTPNGQLTPDEQLTYKSLVENVTQLEGSLARLESEYKVVAANLKQYTDLSVKLREAQAGNIDANIELSSSLNQLTRAKRAEIEASDAYIQKEIEIGAKQFEINQKIKKGIEDATGQTRAEIEASDAYIQKEIEIGAKQFEINQKIKKGIEDATGQTEEKQKAAAARRAAIDEKAAAKKAALDERAAAKKAALDEKAASKTIAENERAANQGIWTWENFYKVTSRMGLRMAASLIWWTLIIDAAQKLFEIWTKVSDEEQISLDRLKEYGDTMKSIAKSVLDMPGEIGGKTRFDQREAANLVNIINDKVEKKTYNTDQRFRAYNDLKSKTGELLSDVKYEEFLNHVNSDKGKKELATVDYYLSVKDRLDASKTRESDITMEISKGDVLRQQLKDEYIRKQLSGQGDYLVDSKTHKLTTIQEPGYTRKKINQVELSESERDELIKHFSDVYDKAAKDGKVISDNSFEGAAFDAGEYLKRMGNGRNLDSFIKADTDIKIKQEVKKNLLIPIRNRNIKDEQIIYGLGGDVKHKKDREGFKDEYMIARENETGVSNKNKGNIDLAFAESAGSVHDIEIYHKSLEDEAQRHFDEMYKINHKALGGGYDTHKSKQEINNYQQEDDAKKREADAKNLEATKHLTAEESKAQQERIVNLEAYVNKIHEINESARISVQKQEDESLKVSSEMRKAKHFNPVQAFLGGGSESEAINREEEFKALDLNISHTNDNAIQSAYDYSVAHKDEKEKREKVVNNKTFYGLNPSSDEFAAIAHTQPQQSIDDYKFDFSEFEKADEKKKNAKKKSDDDQSEADKAKKQKELTEEEKQKQDKVAIAEAFGNATKKIAQDSFEFKLKQIEIEKANIQGLYDFEMKLAGNNALAKQRIEIETHQKMLALKRQEARLQKEEGVFNAIIATSEAVVNSLKVGLPAGAILAAIAAAAGAVQIANITSTPLPQYRKGGNVSSTGFAQINEDGFEFVERDNKLMVFGGGVAPLKQGDYVHTHEKSMDIIRENRFVRDLTNGIGLYKTVMENDKNDMRISIAQGITKQDVESAMKSALKDMPTPIIQLPAQSVQDRHVRQALRHGL